MNINTYCFILLIIILFYFSNYSCFCNISEHFTKYTVTCKFCGKSFSTSSSKPSATAKTNIDKKLTKHLNTCSKNSTNSSLPSSSSPPPPSSPPPSSPPPPSSSSLVVSKDGRCGSSYNNTKCFPIDGKKTCCSQHSWCGGEQGSNDAWCSNGGKGIEDGKYDA